MKKGKVAFYSLGIFLLFFGIFLFIHSNINDFLGTDDPYYHAEHSELIAESGKLTLVKPWIEFHFLANAPADPYFLSHLVAAGLIKIFGVIWGIKILSALFAASIFFVFYLILKSEQVRHTWIFLTLFFFSSVNFIFRLTLERPYVFSIALLLLAYYLIRREKYLWLFVLSIFHCYQNFH